MQTIELLPISQLKFALLGSGKHLCHMAGKLIAMGFPPPVIVTHPQEEHERDRLLLGRHGLFGDVFQVADKLGLELIQAEDVNRAEVIRRLLDMNCTAAFSLSCRSIVKKEFIDALGRRVFNIHPTLLPAERGGGTFSWRIMNGSREVAATIHVLDQGIDTGSIILQDKQDLDQERPLPKDYLAATNGLYANLIDCFLERISNGDKLTCTPQDEESASYFPRLYTELNGAINWGWPAEHIEAFIRAFSHPYPGAFTYLNGEKVQILAASIIEDAPGFHPFLSGKIYAVLQEGAVKVAAPGGALLVSEIAFDDKIMPPAELCKTTQTFHTPPDILENAMLSVPRVKKMIETPRHIK